MADESVETQTTEAATTDTAETSAAETQATEASSSSTDDENVDLAATKTSEEPAKTGDEPAKTGDDEPNELIGAPEEGTDYEITGLPEGMEVDAEMLGKATPLLRGLNASNAAASQLAGLVAEQIEKAGEARDAALEQSIVARRADWETEARDMIAGKVEAPKNEAGEALSFDGKTHKEVMAISARVLDKYAPAGFRDFLKETGLSVHPSMVAMMYQVGKGVAEDRDFEEAPSTSEKKKSTTEKFFGR